MTSNYSAEEKQQQSLQQHILAATFSAPEGWTYSEIYITQCCMCLCVSVKARLITGFYCCCSRAAWCLANPHNSAHTGPSPPYHYILSTLAAPSLAHCWSLQLSLAGNGGKGSETDNGNLFQVIVSFKVVAAGDGGSLQSQSISGFHFRGMIHAEAGPFTLCRGLCLLGENSARGGNAKKKKTRGKTHQPFMVKSL